MTFGDADRLLSELKKEVLKKIEDHGPMDERLQMANDQIGEAEIYIQGFRKGWLGHSQLSKDGNTMNFYNVSLRGTYGEGCLRSAEKIIRG